MDELLWPEDRPVDVRLSGEVDDCLAARAGAGDGVRVGDVADDELRTGALEVRRIPGVGQLVEDDDVLPAATSRLTKCEPMKPAPPVTRTRIRGSLAMVPG